MGGQHNCPVCGFQNLELDLRCQKCGRRLPQFGAMKSPRTSATPNGTAVAIPVVSPAAAAPPAPALPEHVRNEIHSRVERFKARRRGQTLPLPFEEPVLAEEEKLVPFPALEFDPPVKISRPRANRESKPSKTNQEAGLSGACDGAAVQGYNVAETPTPSITVLKPFAELVAYPAGRDEILSEAPPSTPVDLSTQVPLFVPPSEQARPQWQNFHIAAITKRAAGMSHDAGFLLFGVLLFAAPFYWIAGKPPLSLYLLSGFLFCALLLSLLYGTLFLAVFGKTPGMAAAGLRLVSFSGQPANLHQRGLRIAGALISAGSFLFGYLWAFVDEEKLCWHDHISKTVLTDSPE